MTEVFQRVLNMSITGSIVILAVLAARLILKRAPKVFSYGLWAVVLFRLLCPVSLTSPFSLLGAIKAPATDRGTVEYVSLKGEIPSAPTADHPGEIPAPVAPVSPSAEETVSPLPVIWLAGIFAAVVFNIAQLLRLRRKLVGAVPVTCSICLADHIPTPFVLGIVKPKIYLPSTLTGAEREYIIRHEEHHIRRGDHVVKLLSFLALCIHWFNPLVWLAFALSGKDMEMSCDEAVMKKIGTDIRADYSSSLLKFSTGRRIVIGTPLAFGEGDTKARIKNIMKYKKPRLIIVALAAVLCVTLTACLSSNPETGNEPISKNDDVISDYRNTVSRPEDQLKEEREKLEAMKDELASKAEEEREKPEDEQVTKLPTDAAKLMAIISVEDIKYTDIGSVNTDELAAALNGAAGSEIPDPGNFWGHYYADIYLSVIPGGYSGEDEHFNLFAGLDEKTVMVRYYDGAGYNETRYFSDSTLYWILRNNFGNEGPFEEDSYAQYRDIINARCQSFVDETMDMSGEAAIFTGFEIPTFAHTDTLGKYEVYQWEAAFTTDRPNDVGWAGGMYLDNLARVRAFDGYTYFVVDTETGEHRFLFWDLYSGSDESHQRENALLAIEGAFAR